MPTTRGYPIFSGGQAPAGPAQMQQLAEAIDADVTAVRAGLLSTIGTNESDIESKVAADRVRLTSLEYATGAAVPLASGWATVLDHEPLRSRVSGKSVEVFPTMLRRTSALAMTPGTLYTVATLPAGQRPAERISNTGAIGVGGNLGVCVVEIWPDGAVRVAPFVAGGTMGTDGAFGNSVSIGYVKFGPA